jgi:hypothetical protein
MVQYHVVSWSFFDHWGRHLILRCALCKYEMIRSGEWLRCDRTGETGEADGTGRKKHRPAAFW